MGSTRFWLILICAQIAGLLILAALGSTTAATPALRYAGWACLAGIFLCLPPLFLKLFVAGQVKIGNGMSPTVRSLQQNETVITVGVWAMIAVALALALPRIRSDISAENASSADANGRATDVAIETASAGANAGANAGTNAGASATPELNTANIATANAASAPPDRAATVANASSHDNAATAPANDTAHVLTPASGSKTRTAILDAVRERLKMKGRFKVDHIRTYKTWAFVRATEVVELDKGELQETDLTVSALLELPANSTLGFWRIVELWTLPDNEKHSMADFVRAVRAKQRAERLPAALFPDDLL